ncbi:hypothetical protein [Arthrobacter sp. ISL-30]|uniref:hypothetical protein n=1 Tax=Arthrobacter sp. ISL-30 TaxID=2819109 RepID=UPI001BE984EE|nr:hypothetical protein [Arthrobacter sp. ISL-30]MBT2512856.1 hypothetical protein [Arthrobacter sp. ISL-30]
MIHPTPNRAKMIGHALTLPDDSQSGKEQPQTEEKRAEGEPAVCQRIQENYLACGGEQPKEGRQQQPYQSRPLKPRACMLKGRQGRESRPGC